MSVKKQGSAAGGTSLALCQEISKDPEMSEEMVGVAEISEILGVSRQRVHQIAGVYDDFPAPIAELTAGRIWRKKDIEGWLKDHPQRPPGRPSRKGKAVG